MKTLKLTAIIILGLVIASCSKEETKTTTTNTDKTALLCGKAYSVTAFTLQIGGGTPMDYYAQMESCEKDNTLTFNTNGTTLEDEGATKCDPDDPQTVPGTWSFNADKTKITYDGEEASIITLDGTTLKVQATTTDSTFGEIKAVITYTKK